MKNNWKFAGLALLATLACRPAFAKDSSIPGPNSFVRILHAVTSGPKVDVYIDGKKKLNDVEFSAITKYLRVASGRHTFRITSNNPTRTILTATRTLRNGDFYTLGAYGSWAKPRLFAYDDSNGNVPYNHSLITFFNLATAGPTFSVRVTLKQNGDMIRVVKNLRYGHAYIATTPALPLSMRLMANGTTLKTITGAEPRAGRKYAAYVIGRVQRNFRVMLVDAASQ